MTEEEKKKKGDGIKKELTKKSIIWLRHESLSGKMR